MYVNVLKKLFENVGKNCLLYGSIILKARVLNFKHKVGPHTRMEVRSLTNIHSFEYQTRSYKGRNELPNLLIIHSI